jgi:hypothetical protein
MRECAECFTSSLRSALGRRIGLPGIIERNEMALTGKAALEMFAQFLGRRSVFGGACAHDGGQQQKQEGLHLEMLVSLAAFAREERTERRVPPIGERDPR